ncbi:hypothetical protein JK359_04040 [Streptomyces actinomycinicus]|uniref:Uncharacterized protein n=1 Tax=Streptomyces actinomycinicus TaxID=1695166 RepID=A0A937EDX4_9ACTN|nr:hypothetical protein [Streptomyces actinomycinicus]MBL1081153.1 hypothetical protein [Streptomyces actinomycinicus]
MSPSTPRANGVRKPGSGSALMGETWREDPLANVPRALDDPFGVFLAALEQQLATVRPRKGTER